MRLVILILLSATLFCQLMAIRSSHGASSQNIVPEVEHDRAAKAKACHAVAVTAIDAFNTLKQNPKAMLNGMYPEDESMFAFIRQWVRDKKSRDELYRYVINHCLGVEV